MNPVLSIGNITIFLVWQIDAKMDAQVWLKTCIEKVFSSHSWRSHPLKKSSLNYDKTTQNCGPPKFQNLWESWTGERQKNGEKIKKVENSKGISLFFQIFKTALNF
jgi:hypothetical protein